jgi:hypothetical protein
MLTKAEELKQKNIGRGPKNVSNGRKRLNERRHPGYFPA